ncbi:ImmA/IrrE family metallo-endopeptidase [Pseudomonas nicosulfuronedens]
MQDTTPMSAKAAFETLKAAGYPRAYIEKLLPEWWDNSLFKSAAGVTQFALILKQRLGLSVHIDNAGNLVIDAKPARTRFKHRSDTLEAELNVAASLGIALSKLALFCAKQPYSALPADPKVVREKLLAVSGRGHVDFEGLLDLCWVSGIPVLFLSALPKTSKRMTGMALSIEGRPVIVLGLHHDQHSRQLFVLAHELGHILCGHLEGDSVLIDEDLVEVTDSLAGSRTARKDAEEKEADAFALSLIRNGHSDAAVAIRADSAVGLASAAAIKGQELGVDPGHLILSYARANDDWMRANMALGYGRSQTNALKVIKERFFANTDLQLLSDENREHALTIQGFHG